MGFAPNDLIATIRARAEQARALVRRALFKTSQRLSTLVLLGLAAALFMPVPVVRDVFDRMAGERADNASAPVILSSTTAELVVGHEVNGVAAQRARELPMTLAAAGATSRRNRSVTSDERRRAAALPITLAREVAPKLARLTAKPPATWVKARDVEFSPTPKMSRLADHRPVAAKSTASKSKSPAVTLEGADAAGAPARAHAADGAAEPQPDVWDAETIARARSQCAKILAKANVVFDDAEPMKQGACGSAAPVRVEQAGLPPVAVKPAATMNCRMAASLSAWLTKEVQPSAQKAFGVQVVRLLSVSSYACRNRYGRAEAPLSEHAFANAIDLSGFVLADGTVVEVRKSWGPTARDARPETVKITVAKLDMAATKAGASPSKLGAGTIRPPVSPSGVKPPEKASVKEQDGTKVDDTPVRTRHANFLRSVHRGACGIFGTVLGPEANDAHRDHLHLDLKQRRRRAYCE